MRQGSNVLHLPFFLYYYPLYLWNSSVSIWSTTFVGYIFIYQLITLLITSLVLAEVRLVNQHLAAMGSQLRGIEGEAKKDRSSTYRMLQFKVEVKLAEDMVCRGREGEEEVLRVAVDWQLERTYKSQVW
jgi:hypothetical protein